MTTVESSEATVRLQKAETHFRSMQERLKNFIQQHMEITIDGLEFVSTHDRDRLGRELTELKHAHDAAGAEWAAALANQRRDENAGDS